jgi:RHS repeat-associated protein
MAWAASGPHYVSVVWPDGHAETFDFTPAGGSNLFWFGTSAFTARSGSTSKLEAVGDPALSYKGDGYLYAGISGSSVYAPTQFRLTAKDGSVYILDTTKGLISETDRVGNTVTIDPLGIHSSLGPSITFVRDSRGLISELDKPDGTKVTYGYSAGNLASVTDERGKTVKFQYDTAHNLTKTIDPDGRPLRTLTYSPDGRLQTVTDGAGNTSSISVDPNARTETVTGPDPRLTTVTSLNERGDIGQIDELFGGKTLTTKFTYDEFGHTLSKTDPAGHVTGATYDAAGSPLTLTEPDGGTWTFAYNDHEQLTSITDRTDQQLVSLGYDSRGRLVKKTAPDGGVTAYIYGSSGRPTSVTDPLGRTTTYSYDSAGRASTVTGPDNRAWAYVYDASGRTSSVTDPANETTSFAYDAAGDLTSYADALGHSQSYIYDALGHVITVSDALGHATTYTYDQAGRLSSSVDRNGQTTRFTYDESSDVTAAALPDGSSLSYVFDPLGRLTDANDADATLHFAYDDASNLASQTSTGTTTSNQPSVTLSFGRDTAGRPTSLTAPWGTTGYAYDANGLLDKVTDPTGGVFSLGYDPLGRLASLSRPNGVADAYSYDKTGQFSSRASSLGSAVIDALSSTYDSSGRRTSKTDNSGTTTYGYDTADRLISVLAPTGSSLPNETFTYDAAGNQTGNGQHYDAANRLLSDAKFDYAYDNEGNQTTKTERATGKLTTYTWNALHQLTSAHLPDGSTVAYRYDALGRRVEQASPAGTTRYVNLGANVVAEYDGANTLRASYLTTLGTGNLPGMPLESNVGGSATYPLLDGVGSVTGTTDAGGTLSAFSYTAYGTPVGASSGTYSYGTYGYDAATGLYYARARYYDPGTGRFLSEDPVTAVQRYGYANGSPSLLGDPTGLDPLVETGTIEEAEGLEAYASAGEANVDVYVGIESDGSWYTGVTKDIGARMAAHGDRFVTWTRVALDVTRRQARVVETTIIRRFGDATTWAAKEGTVTPLTNIIRSVSAANPLFGLVLNESVSFVDLAAVLDNVAEWVAANGGTLP